MPPVIEGFETLDQHVASRDALEGTGVKESPELDDEVIYSTRADDGIDEAPLADADIEEEVPYLPWTQEEQEPEWTRDLPTSGLELDWDARGSDWLKQLGELSGPSWSVSRRGGSKKRPGLVFSPIDNARQSTCLWVQRTDSGFRAEVWGSGAVDDRTVADWSDAVQKAYRRLVELPEGNWVAAIRSEGRCQRLAERGDVGGLSLLPAAEPFIEWVKTPHSTGSATLYCSHPVIVEGSDHGVTDFDLGDRPGERLKVLCSLLTVAWDSAWVLMDGPNPARRSNDLRT